MQPRLPLLGNIDRILEIAGGIGNLIGLPLANPGKTFTLATGVPIDGTKGYAKSALWFNTKNGGIYENTGTYASSVWVKHTAGATAVQGVAAGYKIARGQKSTVTASDTVVTGLATVVSVVATLESDPVDTCSLASAAIGDQAGSPAAGSVLIKTWMPTTGGVAGNPTLIAATTFTKKVNWIAVGT